LPNEKQPKELKVTDKRIFTPDGDIRAEYQNEIKPAETPAQAPAAAAAAADTAAAAPQPQQETPKAPPQQQQSREERRRSMADRATSPNTPFANFIQSLVMQAYMFLGMLRDPRAREPMFDAAAARETIDILILLKEKTAGNLTPEEEDFFDAHLGELKLAYVQRTKSI
jgi:hypothetical protein